MTAQRAVYFEDVRVVTDHFTRSAQAYPMINKTAKTIASIMFENFIALNGLPSIINSEQGPNFLSSLMKELCELAGIAKRTYPLTTPWETA